MTATSVDVKRMEAIVARLRRTDVAIRFIDGWQTRGRPYTFSPRGILDHHDASTVKSGTWGALAVVVNGRPGISGPLSQFMIARGGVPQIAVVAAGRANHAGTGGGPTRRPPGIPVNSGNAYLMGEESANDGISEPYSAATLYAHKALFVAVLDVVVT